MTGLPGDDAGHPDPAVQRETSTQVVGFACNWDTDPPRTWSGTAWSLWKQLELRVAAPDVGVHLPPLARRALQVASRRRRNGSWVSTWEHSPMWQSRLQRSIQANVARAACDVVVEIQDIAVVDRPFFIYQDLSYDVLAAERQRDPRGVASFFRTVDDATLERRRERQRTVYEAADGVIAMSRWFANSLVRDTGLPPEKVHVVYPGATALHHAADLAAVRVRPSPRRRLLFVGTSFLTKGGDLVLQALELVRRHDPSIRLTVAGPSTWPLRGAPPAGVDFLGNCRRNRS